MKVLACDGIHEDGLSLFRDAGWEVAVAPSPLKDQPALAAALDALRQRCQPGAHPASEESHR